jgi:hypothetical protein
MAMYEYTIANFPWLDRYPIASQRAFPASVKGCGQVALRQADVQTLGDTGKRDWRQAGRSVYGWDDYVSKRFVISTGSLCL